MRSALAAYSPTHGIRGDVKEKGDFRLIDCVIHEDAPGFGNLLAEYTQAALACATPLGLQSSNLEHWGI